MNELSLPFYRPELSYAENNVDGPFALFADGKQIVYLDEPKYELLGQELYSPLGIPAGPLANGDAVKAALDHGYSLATYKTVRTREYPCHESPNVLGLEFDGVLTAELAEKGLVAVPIQGEVPKNITNSFGVPSTDPDVWQPDMASAVAHAKKGQIVVASFQGTPKGDGNVETFIQDYVLAARLAKETGAKILQANVSCPNEGKENVVCTDLDTTERIAYAIKNEIGDVLLDFKIPDLDADKVDELTRRVGRWVDAFTFINTVSARTRNNYGAVAFPGPGRERSGVSGELIQSIARQMVIKMVTAREKYGMHFALIATGGVLEPADVDDRIGLGADFCTSAAGTLHNPQLGFEVLDHYKVPYQMKYAA